MTDVKKYTSFEDFITKEVKLPFKIHWTNHKIGYISEWKGANTSHLMASISNDRHSYGISIVIINKNTMQTFFQPFYWNANGHQGKDLYIWDTDGYSTRDLLEYTKMTQAICDFLALW
jgi:hypothetical protein